MTIEFWMILSFKIAPVDDCQYYEDLPTKEHLRKGFEGLRTTRAKAIYLFTATIGLRKGEIFGLLKSQGRFDYESRHS